MERELLDDLVWAKARISGKAASTEHVGPADGAELLLGALEVGAVGFMVVGFGVGCPPSSLPVL